MTGGAITGSPTMRESSGSEGLFVPNLPRLLFPVKDRSIGDLIGAFGDAREGGARRHEGVDIAAPRGTEVVAVADGVIERVSVSANGGRQIWMRSDALGLRFFYGHLDRQLVRPGAQVSAGQQIGTVGNTGNARGATPHLHFEVRFLKETAVDPAMFFDQARP